MTEHSADPEFNAFLRDSWRETSMERDRSLLNLSTAGVGLLATLLTFRTTVTKFELVLYVAGALCFAVAITCALAIFKKNAHHIEQVIRGKAGDTRGLKQLDRVLVGCFYAGLVFTTSVAGYIGYSRLQ